MIFAIIYLVIGLIVSIWLTILTVKHETVKEYEDTNDICAPISKALLPVVLIINYILLWPIIITCSIANAYYAEIHEKED